MGIMILYFGVPVIRSMDTPHNNVSAPVINLLGETDTNGQQRSQLLLIK